MKTNMAGSNGSSTATSANKKQSSALLAAKTSTDHNNGNNNSCCHNDGCQHNKRQTETANLSHQSWLASKYACVDYDKDLNIKHFKGLETLVVDRPHAKFPLLLPTHITNFWTSDVIENLENHMMDEGDILLYTPPKCGTHWMWEILSMLVRATATYNTQAKHSFWLEMQPYSSIVQKSPSTRRVLNTHQMLSQLPPKFRLPTTKTVACVRNPKDVLVSAYYHFRNIIPHGEDGQQIPFNELYDFLAKSKYVPFGRVLDHFEDLWDNHRHDPNILLVYYEDLKENTLQQIRRVANHIGVPYTEEFLSQVCKAVDISNMKTGKYSSEENIRRKFGSDVSLYRKGEIGDWRTHFTPAQNEDFDRIFTDWNKHRKMPFRFEPSHHARHNDRNCAQQ